MAADNLQQTALHQMGQQLTASHAADRFHVGPRDRLPIRDNCQCLLRRRADSEFAAAALSAHEPGTIGRPSHQLKSTGNFFNLKGGSIGVVKFFQAGNLAFRFGGVGQAGGQGDLSRGQRFFGQKKCGLNARQARIAGMRIGRRWLQAFGADSVCETRSSVVGKPIGPAAAGGSSHGDTD